MPSLRFLSDISLIGLPHSNCSVHGKVIHLINICAYMNEAKILAIDPSCWSWVNIWRLSWAGGHLKASQDVGSTAKVGTAHQVATGKTATAVTPQHIWRPWARGREPGVRLLLQFLSMCWSTLSSLSVCLSPPWGLRWKSLGVISGIKTRPEFAHWDTGPSSSFQGVLLAVAHVDTLLFSLITLLSPQLSEGFWRKANLRPTLPPENETLHCKGALSFSYTFVGHSRVSWHGAHAALCFPNLNILEKVSSALRELD